jgi:hypothetical protein
LKRGEISQLSCQAQTWSLFTLINQPVADENRQVSRKIWESTKEYMGMGQNPIPLVNIKIAGKWMFIPLKMVLIGIDPYPYYDIH